MVTCKICALTRVHVGGHVQRYVHLQEYMYVVTCKDMCTYKSTCVWSRATICALTRVHVCCHLQDYVVSSVRSLSSNHCTAYIHRRHVLMICEDVLLNIQKITNTVDASFDVLPSVVARAR